jgi:hypothetical protein
MDECLENLPGVKTIDDGIIVFGKDQATHDRNLDLFMKRCREMNIKLNPDKTEVSKTEILFLVMCLQQKVLKWIPQR